MSIVEMKDGKLAISAKNRATWRKWLAKNGDIEKSVWLILYRISSTTPTVSYEHAVEEALCFGWIDSKKLKRDGESFYLAFTPRKPKSNWSASNKERVKRLIAEGLMTPSGQAMIDLAKKTGTWTIKPVVPK